MARTNRHYFYDHLFFYSLLLFCLPSTKADYNILSFGAKSGGRTDSTTAFLRAWSAACRSSGSATIHVPKGKFLIGRHVAFQGPCKSGKIVFEIQGTLVAPSGYGKLGKEWLTFNHVDGVTINGGMLDGRGASLWSCKTSHKSCPSGSSSLVFSNSRNIMINALTSINSKLYHIVIHGCRNVKVQGVKITAPGSSPNTDGIHVQGSSDVTITGTGIKTGDDCVSVGPATTNLWIERVTCGPGHGISIGSLGKASNEGGVRNVTVKTTVFSGTQNGLRIKTWGRPSDGFVRGVVFEHALMKNVRHPIVINQNYCPHQRSCPNNESGVKISGVTYDDIRGTSATPVAVAFDCSPSNPCRGITLKNIKLTYGSGHAKSSCQHADGRSSGFVVPPSCL